ncbi:MAG: Crp/Fnr family transcriptional regulator [Bacteroidota bacterium]
MEDFQLFLQQFPDYSEARLHEIIPYLSSRNIPLGEYQLQEGRICKEIAFIEKGLLRLYYLRDGKEITHCFCREKSISTSYRSLISQEASDIAIQAVENSSLLLFSYDSLKALYKQHPFWQQMGRLLAEGEYVVREDHSRFLHDLSAKERYEHILEHDPALLQRVPLTYLASYLQLTPETLSRIRRELSRN